MPTPTSAVYTIAGTSDLPDVIPTSNPSTSTPVKPESMVSAVTKLELFVSLTVSIVLWIIYGTVANVRNYNVPMVYDVYTYTDVNDAESVVWQARSDFNYNVGLVLPFIPLITVLGCTIEWIMISSRYTTLPSRVNPWRWLTRSLSYPFLATAVVTSFGEVDLLSLVALFALNHVVVLLGYFQETSNQAHHARENYQPTWAPFIASTWVSLLSYLPLLITLSVSKGNDQIGALDWAALAMFILSGVMNGIIQVGYYRFLANPTAGMWPYNRSRGGVTNYAIYDSFLTASSLLFDSLAVILLISSAAQAVSFTYPALS